MGRLSEHLIDYSPARWLRGPHAQTWIGAIAGPWPSLPWPRRVTVDLPDGARLIGLENSPAPPVAPCGVVLILHGLAVDAEVPYVRRAAACFLERGFVTVRLNYRGAGAGAGLSSRLYHCGLSDDLGTALEVIAERHPGLPVVVVGYSMSGNTVLRLLGERGAEALNWLSGAVAFNPPIDLHAVARHIDQPSHRLYMRCFARLIVDQARINAERYGRPLPEQVETVRTLPEFDARYTCPAWGFDSVDAYYQAASCKPLLDNIAVPTLIVADHDDPIVPMSQWDGVRCSRSVELIRTQGGGHMGYVANEPTPDGHRRWIDHALAEAVEHLARFKTS